MQAKEAKKSKKSVGHLEKLHNYLEKLYKDRAETIGLLTDKGHIPMLWRGIEEFENEPQLTVRLNALDKEVQDTREEYNIALLEALNHILKSLKFDSHVLIGLTAVLLGLTAILGYLTYLLLHR